MLNLMDANSAKSLNANYNGCQHYNGVQYDLPEPLSLSISLSLSLSGYLYTYCTASLELVQACLIVH